MGKREGRGRMEKKSIDGDGRDDAADAAAAAAVIMSSPQHERCAWSCFCVCLVPGWLVGWSVDSLTGERVCTVSSLGYRLGWSVSQSNASCAAW